MKFLSVAKYLSLAILAINDETAAAKHLKGGRKNDNTNNHSSVEAAEEAEIISNITSRGSKNEKRKVK